MYLSESPRTFTPPPLNLRAFARPLIMKRWFWQAILVIFILIISSNPNTVNYKEQHKHGPCLLTRLFDLKKTFVVNKLNVHWNTDQQLTTIKLKKLSKVYDSIQKQFKANIRDLRSLKRERTTVAHHRRRTVEQQIERTSYKKLAILTCLLILNIKMFFMLLSMNSMLFMGNRIEYHCRF